jgi:hypothetical protein
MANFWGFEAQNPQKWRRTRGEEEWVACIYSPDLTEAGDIT